MSTLEIDGSRGEGGGQVLRTSLALSMATGRAFRMVNIRAGRPKPGLAAQHLAAVKAATEISGANVVGAQLRSMEVVFEPGAPRGGEYHFDIGTAGSAILLLQSIFEALSHTRPRQSNVVTITGGTHVPWSPSFHYARDVWLRAIRRIGYRANIEMRRPGFYPKGGGRLEVVIDPHEPLTPVDLAYRGLLVEITGVSLAANLPEHVARRQKGQALARLHQAGYKAHIDTEVAESDGPGSASFLRARFEGGIAGFSAVGARGKRAERVADEAVEPLLAHLRGKAPVDTHLEDQLVVPLMFANGRSRIIANPITTHLETNVRIANLFLPGAVELHGQAGKPGRVVILGGRHR